MDQRPHLRSALASCRSLRAALKKAREQWESWETEDLREFKKWQSEHFGREIADLQRLHQEIDAKQFLYDSVCRLSFMNRIPLAEALRIFESGEDPASRVSDDPSFESDPDDGFFDQDFHFSDDDADDDDENDAGIDPDFDLNGLDVLLNLNTDGMFSQLDPNEQETMRRDFCREFGIPYPPDSSKFISPQSEDAAIKALYRRLALRLHPDRCRDDSAPTFRQHLETLQEAYENKDLRRMRVVEALIDLEDEGMGLHLGLARLQDLADHFREMLEPLKASLREARSFPQWGFASSPAVRRRAEMELPEVFEIELEEAQSALQALDRQLESLRNPPLNKRKSRKKTAEGLLDRQMEFF